MGTYPLQASGSVTLDASGNGRVILGPNIPGVAWTPSGGTCQTSTGVLTPVFNVYLNSVSPGNNQGGSQTGNNDSFVMDGVTLYTGMTLIGVWTGGDSGATGTFNLSGSVTAPGP